MSVSGKNQICGISHLFKFSYRILTRRDTLLSFVILILIKLQTNRDSCAHSHTREQKENVTCSTENGFSFSCLSAIGVETPKKYFIK